MGLLPPSRSQVSSPVMTSSEGITPHKDLAKLLFFHFMDQNVHKMEEPAPRMEEPTPKS
jgi:hypothetical protein